MSLLSIEELRTLVEQPQGSCASIYMPAIKAGPEIRQNEIRFKNLVRTAEHKLVETGLSEKEANQLFQPLLDAIVEENDFWNYQDEGLALFLSQNFYRYYRLPRSFAELVVVNDHFHLKPLLPIVAKDGQFYILTLSQKDVRLLEADPYSIREVEVPNLPKNMDEALDYDETAKDGQFRIATSKGGTSNSFQQPGAFHGQGSPDRDDIRQDLLQFFHQIDHALHEFLRGKQAPLILACVEYEVPIYHEANTYPHLLKDYIPGNVKNQKIEELRQAGWAISEPHFLKAQQDAVNYYGDLTGSDKVSTDLTETVPAAYYGRVDQLFVAVGVQRWGTFDPVENEIQIHQDAQPGDEDLLDAAAIQTLLNGGRVYAVEPDQVPNQATIAAVFRY